MLVEKAGLFVHGVQSGPVVAVSLVSWRRSARSGLFFSLHAMRLGDCAVVDERSPKDRKLRSPHLGN